MCMFCMQVSSVGLANQVIPRTSKDPLKKFIYTQRDGLVESPSSVSWLYRIKPPFSRPLVGMQCLTADMVRQTCAMPKAQVHDQVLLSCYSMFPSYCVW